jgi:nucleolar protein 6
MGNISNGKFAPRAERKAKKRQRDDMIPDVPEDDTPADSAEQPEAAPTKESRPAKKPRVSKSTKEVVKSETGASSGPKAKKEASSANEEGQQKKAARFIVFVGNLPFTATADSIKQHFKAVHPSSIRNLTKKDDPTKSKGCAFVEFANYDHMKTCLKTFHHSMFNDGISPARKINVELT